MHIRVKKCKNIHDQKDGTSTFFIISRDYKVCLFAASKRNEGKHTMCQQKVNNLSDMCHLHNFIEGQILKNATPVNSNNKVWILPLKLQKQQESSIRDADSLENTKNDDEGNEGNDNDSE